MWILMSLAAAKPPVPTLQVGSDRVKVGTVQAWSLRGQQVKLTFHEAKAAPCDPAEAPYAENSVVFVPRRDDAGPHWVLDAVFASAGSLYGAEMGRFDDLPRLAQDGARTSFVLPWVEPPSTGDDVKLDFGGTFEVVGCGADKSRRLDAPLTRVTATPTGAALDPRGARAVIAKFTDGARELAVECASSQGALQCSVSEGEALLLGTGDVEACEEAGAVVLLAYTAGDPKRRWQVAMPPGLSVAGPLPACEAVAPVVR